MGGSARSSSARPLSCWYPKIASAWRQDPSKEAAALIDMASHLYDLIEYFSGPIRKLPP